jgi:hypothetical protein
MYPIIVVILDVIVFILALTAALISIFKIKLVCKGNSKFGWWWILPIIMVWTTIVRGLYVLVAIDIIPVIYSPYITASQIVFYVGVVIWVWDFYIEAKKTGN